MNTIEIEFASTVWKQHFDDFIPVDGTWCMTLGESQAAVIAKIKQSINADCKVFLFNEQGKHCAQTTVSGIFMAIKE